jgi:hypothetical protein
MTDDKITMDVSYDEDGTAISATGGEGLAVTVEHRVNPDNDALEVRYSIRPIGDNAIYAGGATILVTIDKPDPGPNPPENASSIAATYAAGIIESIPTVLDKTLGDAVNHAAKDASEARRDMRSSVDALIKTIALMLLASNAGDVAKTKDMAHRLLRGEEIEGLGGVELPPGLTEETKGDAIARIDKAIDTMAGFIGG